MKFVSATASKFQSINPLSCDCALYEIDTSNGLLGLEEGSDVGCNVGREEGRMEGCFEGLLDG